MVFSIQNGIIEPVKTVFSNGVAAVVAINRKYAHPRITMSPAVKAALLLPQAVPALSRDTACLQVLYNSDGSLK